MFNSLPFLCLIIISTDHTFLHYAKGVQNLENSIQLEGRDNPGMSQRSLVPRESSSLPLLHDRWHAHKTRRGLENVVTVPKSFYQCWALWNDSKEWRYLCQEKNWQRLREVLSLNCLLSCVVFSLITVPITLSPSNWNLRVKVQWGLPQLWGGEVSRRVYREGKWAS